jgi:hypothetical protein
VNTHLDKLLRFSYYTDSNYANCVNFLRLLKGGVTFYPTLRQRILDVKFADLDAEDDGCTPPKTGWGGSLNGLNASEIGTQGANGWLKYNETYYARNRLTKYVSENGTYNGDYWYTFKNPGILLGEGVKWIDFLNFTNETNLASITSLGYLTNSKIARSTTCSSSALYFVSSPSPRVLDLRNLQTVTLKSFRMKIDY